MDLNLILQWRQVLQEEYPELIELGEHSYIGEMHGEMSCAATVKINTILMELFEHISKADYKLEELLYVIIKYKFKDFDISKMEDLFMIIMSLKKNAEEMRDTFNPQN